MDEKQGSNKPFASYSHPKCGAVYPMKYSQTRSATEHLKTQNPTRGLLNLNKNFHGTSRFERAEQFDRFSHLHKHKRFSFLFHNINVCTTCTYIRSRRYLYEAPYRSHSGTLHLYITCNCAGIVSGNTNSGKSIATVFIHINRKCQALQ